MVSDITFICGAVLLFTDVFRSLEVGILTTRPEPLNLRTDQKVRQAFWSVSQSRVPSLAHGILGTVFLVCWPTTRLEPHALNSGSSKLCNRLADLLKESETANQKACLTWPVGLAQDFRFVGKNDMNHDGGHGTCLHNSQIIR